MPRTILVGAILGAHGLKGEVKVKTFTEAPERLAAYGPLLLASGQALHISSLRSVKPDEAVLRFQDITSRDAAEALKGTELFVRRAALPAAEDGEFYHADLIGLRAEDETGRVLGHVCAVHNFGAGDVLEIKRDALDTLMLGFTMATVPVIEIDKGRLIIALPQEVEARPGSADPQNGAEE